MPPELHPFGLTLPLCLPPDLRLALQGQGMHGTTTLTSTRVRPVKAVYSIFVSALWNTGTGTVQIPEIVVKFDLVALCLLPSL